jgi:hypothetical protein
MLKGRWRQMPEISTRILKQHANDFPEPVRSLILQESDFVDAERLITNVGTFEKLLRLNKGGN